MNVNTRHYSGGVLAVSVLTCLVLHATARNASAQADTVTFHALLSEMTDADSRARLPSPAFRQMQASSYNRESKKRGEPGWFADSDGTGFIREEITAGRHEFVAMEHDGPGCLTRMWAPFFYYDFNDRVGPTVRIYLDGSETPTIEAGWIELLTNNEWPESYGPAPAKKNAFRIPSPLARFTARAGDVYLPIPFAKSCKVTFDRAPFYNVINWRAYDPGTRVEAFTPGAMENEREAIEACCKAVDAPLVQVDGPGMRSKYDSRGDSVLALRRGPGALQEFSVEIDPGTLHDHPSLLRTLVLVMTFDGDQTVWCPLGDFFGSPNAVNEFTTMYHAVESGKFTCRWTMPYEHTAVIRLMRLGREMFPIRLSAVDGAWAWDERSMHFHASWRADEVRAGDKIADTNFIDVTGAGVLVGDQWTVLNPTRGWWGEGDEKIYVDASYDRGFPDHFGTGTEDYYGWAGGVNPTIADVFSHPFLANIAVGSWSRGMRIAGAGDTRGFNICTRFRGLDAVPFTSRLVFDMEASPGVDQRKPTDVLGYSSVVFWYARPGATSDIVPDPANAKRPIMSLEQLEHAAKAPSPQH